MTDPLVTVCISTFNRCEDLQNCIGSAMQQDYENLKFVVYDNHSDDETVRLLKSYETLFPESVSVIYGDRDPNAMITLNTTFRHATNDGAKYVLVMDDDAYIKDESVISKLVTSAMKEDAAIVGANVKSEDGMWQMPIRTNIGEFLSPEKIDVLGTFEYYEFHGACALFDVEKCSSVGWYDESFTIYMNELDLATKALNAGYKVMIRSDAAAYHRGVGDKNACNTRAYYFIRNYNTVLTRNFRTFVGRLKAITLHSFMSGGYFAERILIHNTCNSKMKIFKFGYLLTKAYINALYRCMIPDQRHQWKDQDYFEQSMYNGFKRCIADRASWIKGKTPTETKGVR